MFHGQELFNQDIGAWDVAAVTDMERMFSFARSFNQDIGAWEVGNVTTMEHMFSGDWAFNRDLNMWDVSMVTNMESMFTGAIGFNSPIGAWDVSSVTTMEEMFASATIFNQDIGAWDVTDVTNMEEMFRLAVSFDQNIGAWNVINVTNALDMFDGAELSIANYDALLIGWNALNLQPNVPFSGGNSQYCAGEAARTNMINSDGWFITDAGLGGVTVNDLVNQMAVNVFTFPAITGTNLTGNEAYYTGPNGTGTPFLEGDVIAFDPAETYPITLYIYDASGGCQSQEDFELTITDTCNPPTADVLPDDSACTAFVLPMLSPNNTYYTAPNAGGTMLNAGDTVNTSQTLYIYTGVSGCADESSFDITIEGGPTVDDLTNQTVANIFTFPGITGTNLTGNEAYYTGPNGTGTAFLAGDVIAFDPAETYPITLYIYDASGGCASQEDFELTLTNDCNLPTADALSDVTACTAFVLPTLSPNNTYYTASNAGGTMLNAGDTVSSSQTLFIYTGVTGCSDETSFSITIGPSFCENEMENTLPNFFTPNGDGINDVWDISSLEDGNAQVFIFDRYGKLLAQLNPISNRGWDGLYLSLIHI